jgi:hypothetical protein
MAGNDGKVCQDAGQIVSGYMIGLLNVWLCLVQFN